MDAGAPFAKALRCFGLVVHSCPDFVVNPRFFVYVKLPLTFFDHDSCQHGTRFKSTFKVACANLLNVPDNSLCIAPHSSCRQSRSHLHLPFRCLLSQPPPSHLAILYAASAVNQILNGKFLVCGQF